MNFSKVTLLPGYNRQQGFEGSCVKINLSERTLLVLSGAFKSRRERDTRVPQLAPSDPSTVWICLWPNFHFCISFPSVDLYVISPQIKITL